jgi:regulator of protease activity HflC (stomatin/prohibitin superfamily)
VKITRIEIKDIAPPTDIVAAMGRQMKAERDKRAAILEAEGKRQAEILRAEGDKQAQVLSAEGRKEAAFRDAEARERSAEAEARATQYVSEAIAAGNIQAINYFVANNYVGALKELAKAPNQKVLMLPVDAAGVIGALGGLAEITREAFGGAGTGPNGADRSEAVTPRPATAAPRVAAQSVPSQSVPSQSGSVPEV